MTAGSSDGLDTYLIGCDDDSSPNSPPLESSLISTPIALPCSPSNVENPEQSPSGNSSIETLPVIYCLCSSTSPNLEKISPYLAQVVEATVIGVGQSSKSCRFNWLTKTRSTVRIFLLSFGSVAFRTEVVKILTVVSIGLILWNALLPAFVISRERRSDGVPATATRSGL